MHDDDLSLEPPRRAHSGIGCLVTTLVIVAMLGVALVLILPTRGASDLIADYLHDRTGLDVTVGRARLSFPNAVVLENIRSRGDGASNGVFSAQEVKLGWGLDGAPVVKARGVELTLVRDEAGGWRPDPFAGVGELTDVAQTAGLLTEFPRLTLDVRDSAITWVSGGTNTASVEGLAFRATPVRPQGRHLWLFEAQASRVLRAGGRGGRAVRRTWISAEENPYLELTYRGVWDETPPATNDWWSRPTPAKPAMGVP